MSNKTKYFTQALIDTFSPSTHWEHCLLLEKDMLEILQYIPIHVSMPPENFKVCSTKLVDVFTRTCFLFEAAIKGISNDTTNRTINFLKQNKYPWFQYLLEGKNIFGKAKDLNILDFLTFYEEYCSLTTLEVRVRYSQNISDVWINQMLMISPFQDMKIENNIVKKSPKWWAVYSTIKHNFYSYSNILNLEITLDALSALISFTAVVPQVRRLLCDHGYIRDNFNNPISIERFGKRLNGYFQKDAWVNHREIVLDGYENEKSLPAIACVSNLFIVPIIGNYARVQLWTGLERN